MKLEIRVEHECNRLLTAPGALGCGDTEFNRLGILNLLSRLGVINNSIYDQIEKSIELMHFENPEPIRNSKSIFNETKSVSRIIEIYSWSDLDIDFDESRVKEEVRKEKNRLLLPAGSLGRGDSAFVRIIFLSVLARLTFIEHSEYLRLINVICEMDFSQSEIAPPVVDSIFYGVQSDTLADELPFG